MTITIYTPRDLLGVYKDDRLASPSTYWRDLCFNGPVHISKRQDIVFEQVKARRRVAPFVLPTSPGRPIYTRDGSTARTFRPAYIKPKDAVLPTEQFDRQPGDLFSDTPRSPQQNFDAEVANVMAFHRSTIDRRWEWLAAQASIYGQVTIEYEDGQSVIIDFGRDAGQTVIKSSAYWDTSYDILGDIQSWADTMSVAQFGGIPNRLTIGAAVWPMVRGNTKLVAEMSTQRRGNPELDIRTGLTFAPSVNANVRFVGNLGAGLDVFVYSDFYENGAGAQVPFMSPKDVVLTCPDVGGVPAFGAIPDVDANLQSLAVFPKMFKQDDPSALFCMTQSAPLFIPVNPNRTFRARVLA